MWEFHKQNISNPVGVGGRRYTRGMSSMQSLTTADVRRMRLRALGVSARLPGTDQLELTGAARVAAAVETLFAIQGQDWRGSHWAVGARLSGSTSQDVDDALNEGLIVRSWPMRGTIHLVGGRDLGWMQQLTNKRALASAPKRREYLGIDDHMLDRLLDTSVEALQAAGRRGLSREQLGETWTEAGIPWKSAWRYHVIWWLCQNSIATTGPVSDGKEPRLVLASSWFSNERHFEGEEALAEFARKYARARGPVTARDLSWWSSLSLTESRTAFRLAAEMGHVVEVSVNETPAWTNPACLDMFDDPNPDDNATYLLAPFDEYLLGYADRTPQIAEQHLRLVDPQRNGSFRAIVVQRGAVVATWRRDTKRQPTIAVTPFPKKRVNQRALRPPAQAWAEFHFESRPEIVLMNAE